MPVPVPVPVVPPVVEPPEGAVLDCAFEARVLNSVREREALAEVLRRILLATHQSCGDNEWGSQGLTSR